MYDTNDFLKEVIRQHKPELTEDQINEVCKGVEFWFNDGIGESIDVAVSCLNSWEGSKY